MNKKLWNIFAIIAIAAGIMVAFMVNPGFMINDQVIIPRTGSWTAVATGENVTDPTTGDNSGICAFWIFTHGHGNSLDVNLSDKKPGYIAGGNATKGDTLDIPHSTAFDVIVWVRGNSTDCNKQTDYLRCNMTAATWSYTLEEADSETQIDNSSTFLWAHYVWDNDGSGYTLTRDQTLSISAIVLEAYK